MLASTHDAIIGSSRLDVINSWNAAATGLYGYSADEIIGQRPAGDHRTGLPGEGG